jgi:hypothetical protein
VNSSCAPRQLPDEDRHPAQLLVPLADREPAHHLPVDDEQIAALGEQLADPGAGAEHQLAGLVGPGVRHDGDARRGGAPAQHPLAQRQPRAVGTGQLELRGDRRLRPDVAGAGLEVGLGRGVGREHRKAGGDLARAEVLVGDPVEARDLARAREERVAGATEDQGPGAAQQGGAAVALDQRPQLVRAPDQRHELRTLADREPGDPRLAVSRAVGVGRLVAIDPDHRRSAQREPMAGGAPHRPQADHDHVGAPLHRHIVGRRAGRKLLADPVRNRRGRSYK